MASATACACQRFCTPDNLSTLYHAHLQEASPHDIDRSQDAAWALLRAFSIRNVGSRSLAGYRRAPFEQMNLITHVLKLNRVLKSFWDSEPLRLVGQDLLPESLLRVRT